MLSSVCVADRMEKGLCIEDVEDFFLMSFPLCDEVDPLCASILLGSFCGLVVSTWWLRIWLRGFVFASGCIRWFCVLYEFFEFFGTENLMSLPVMLSNSSSVLTILDFSFLVIVWFGLPSSLVIFSSRASLF